MRPQGSVFSLRSWGKHLVLRSARENVNLNYSWLLIDATVGTVVGILFFDRIGGGLSNKELADLDWATLFFESLGKETEFAGRFWGLAVELFQAVKSDMLLV